MSEREQAREREQEKQKRDGQRPKQTVREERERG